MLHKQQKGFQQQIEAESAVRHNTSKNITPIDKTMRLEKEREVPRQRGEEFAEWQKESAKLERNRVINATEADKQDFDKEKEIERERSHFQCVADKLTTQPTTETTTTTHNTNEGNPSKTKITPKEKGTKTPGPPQPNRSLTELGSNKETGTTS